ncbi:Translocating chain-associated membrane protein [Dermatophagoides farinae]|uniref:Translocating chain-associated membrane protein n=1 Tax=Dermatophagoides farinae TaxID=6954 RepID=A0A922HUJ3_DERFA|nr:Translocating chain-associated membrane protein [Dermatophagoides farinae]
MAIKRRTGSVKSPPILSHEFFIQNHADIISCLAMIIVVSLLFQATSPYAAYFVALQHNTTEALGNPMALYSSGPKDLCVIFFYFLISIVIHAVVQEYIIDKINRKLHLSKTKHSKFNESGQLLVFFLLSIVWAGEILRREGFLLPLQRLWQDYPERHVEMPYINKYYFIVQIAYWLHAFPELYFQKVKRDELVHRASYSLLYLFLFIAAYYLNFTRIALCLSLIHYLSESFFHLSRLLYFSNKTKISGYIFNIWNVIFVLVRFLSISVSVLTFWYGFAATSSPSVDFATGNFNTPLIRLFCLTTIGFLQAWMMLNFITFHLQRLRERAAEIARRKKNVHRPQKMLDADINDLPEVDQQQSTVQTNQIASSVTATTTTANAAVSANSSKLHSPKSTGKLKVK